jgi:hypothetical protein
MVPAKKITVINRIAGEDLFISWHNVETICALHGTIGDALHLVEGTGDIFTLMEKL